MRRFRVLAADDEPLALELARDLLARDPEVELVAACADGAQALEAIRRRRPDVAFLDVEMPELDGLGVARAVAPEELPALVFVTAFGHHAIRAFEVAALDYVVKPFADERFFAALERAKRRVREKRLGELAGRVATLAAELDADAPPPPSGDPPAAEPPAPAHSFLTRLRIPKGDRALTVELEDVLWIESCDYYARVHTADGSHLVRKSLAAFEQELDPGRFVRVHRRAIVRADAVREVRRSPAGGRRVILRDGTRVAVSRSRWRRIARRLATTTGHRRDR